jgi:hypothetical protein
VLAHSTAAAKHRLALSCRDGARVSWIVSQFADLNMTFILLVGINRGALLSVKTSEAGGLQRPQGFDRKSGGEPGES